MVRIIAVLRRKDGMTAEGFYEHWHHRHPDVVTLLPGLRRYVQHPARPYTRPWPFDGMAELWFDSVRDVAVAFDSPAADAMRDDEAHFIGSIEWILADEAGIEVPLSAGSRGPGGQ